MHALFLAAASPFGLLRNMELFSALFGIPGAPRLHFEAPLGIRIESLLDRPFPLQSPASALVFVALALAATLVVFWAVAVLAVPVVVALAWLFPDNATQRFTAWLWQRAFPLGVLVSFASPCLLIPVHGALRGHGATIILGSTIVIAVAMWLGLVAIVRDAASLRRFMRRGAFASSILAALVWSGALVSVALGMHTPRSPAPAHAPNILLVSIDSLRRDHVHCYGYARETSPTIDALARGGVMFRTAVSPTSWTLPAHLTLLTAIPPEQHGVVDDETRLREEAVFLSEVVWQAGYTTAGFVSAPYLDATYGFSQGFDHYDDYTIAHTSHDASREGITSPALLRIVTRWLDGWNQQGRTRPFFIFMHMWDVHYDYAPPPPYDTMFDPEYRGTVTGKNYEYSNEVHPGMDPRDLQHIIALYDGEIRFTDLYLGRVLDHLRAMGVLDRTIVVVTADHGDEFFEHGHKGHKKTLYDESVLVPLIVRYPPTVPAGKIVDAQVRLMDIAPTIVGLAGITPKIPFPTAQTHEVSAAQNLTPWMLADLTQSLPSLPAFGDLVGEAPVPLASVRTLAAKFIKEQRAAGREEFYDLTADPGEHSNLIAGDGTVNTPLRSALTRWRDTWKGGKLSRKAELSEEHKERLRALGYLR